VVEKTGTVAFTPASKENQLRTGVASAAQAKTECSPLGSLTQWSKDFKIFGRVTQKTDIKTFNGKNGPGKVFSIIILGDDQDEINAKFFNDAVDTHFNSIEKGKCYIFHRG
jgi:replication factor A1